MKLMYSRAANSPLPDGESPARERGRVRGSGSIRCIVTPSPQPSPRRGEGVAKPALDNFTLIVCDNGVYEVTGRQRTPGDPVDFAGLARAAGLRHVWSFNDLDAWCSSISSVLGSPGPRFVHLRVEPLWDEEKLAVPLRETIPAQIARLRKTITNAECGVRNAE